MASKKAASAGAKKRVAKKKAKKPAKRGAGRPEYEPKQADRDKVLTLLGGGMTIEEVAAAIDLSEKTFRKHFAKELLVGRSKRRAEILEAMFNSAKGGNVSAQKAYLQLNALAEADANIQDPKSDQPASPPPAVKAAYKGKKEVAQDEALTAITDSGEWGTDLDPSAPPPGTKAN